MEHTIVTNMDWNMVWTILGLNTALFGIFSGLMLWFVSRVEDRLDAHINSSNAHFDVMAARIDQTQSIIMRMLEKQGR